MKNLRHKTKTIIALHTLCFFLVAAFPVSAEAHEKGVLLFQKKVKKVLASSCLRKNNFGIKIYSLDRGESLFELRAEKLFVPASNLKILTTAVALQTLGPNYRFPTRLYTDGTLKNEVLKGNLYIKGYGDPKFVTEQMWLLVNKLKNLPVRKITGNIIGDDSFFDGRKRVKTWIKNPGAQAYEAPLGALSFNFNTVKAYVSPGPKAGSRPKIVIEPDTEYITLDNQARTIKPGKRNRLIVNRVDHNGFDEITVSGGIRLNQPRAQYFLNITDPTLYTLSALKKYLGHAGIQFKGKTELGKVPETAMELLTHESEPLTLALQGLNKFSNNFVAEQILKTIGTEKYGPPGTTLKGLKAFEEYLMELGYRQGQYKVLDGSGLSRQNRLSPQLIIDVLRYVKNDLGVYPEFVSALGVMGVDGNVKNRMRGVEISERARVKTGTLNFVSALSGYFQSLDGETFAFSILMNSLKCSNGRIKKLQDQIIRAGLHFQRIPTGSVTPEIQEKVSPSSGSAP
ncbi:MAG: D-alanyl-D-alanine carboxypeptidase/D-alanyl-D-alanine-endopeptidase [Nitrospinae bacterium]|nr:D-alanyl-D-alanine carboxypeptidase/D-alanyl-D-alanine-endopeptidase [Nitrospinota bacterium]MBL7021325.1 D-alanyl-D-alanine carboxypeptidase/D-alanyl-D-alanine-endopeptidase [Nitrospinaceae bacterium]